MARKSRSTPKGSKPPRPTLPQHQLPPPYDRLLTLGEDYDEADYEAIAEELRRGDAQAAAERLLKMALDESYYDYWDEDRPDEPRCWTRVHAVRTLELLGEAAQIAVEPLLPLLGEEDDYLREEMPLFYGTIGAAAIEPLARVLNDPEEDGMTRSGAGDALAEIAERHPEARDRVIAVLEQAVTMEREDPTLVGFFIGSLLDVGAQESLPLIRQAFEEERVDETIIEMADVEEHFGLPVTSPRTDWQSLLPDDEAALIEDEEDEDTRPLAAGPVETVQEPYVAPPKVGRNDPCPCGSGKKYKKCCGA